MAERRRLTVTSRARAARAAQLDQPGAMAARTPTAHAASSPWLEAADAIACALADSAVVRDRDVTWIGDDLVGELPSPQVVRGDVGADLYAGTAGIGWSLVHVGAATGRRRVVQVGTGALTSAVARTRASSIASLSLCAGATGVAWAAVDAGTRLARPALVRSGLGLARDVARRIVDAPDSVEEFDLIGGLAGILIGLLAIHRQVADALVLQAATVAAERLAGLAHRDAFGASWRAGGVVAPGLCGLGHGASGAAWALVEAGQATGRREWAPLAQEALRYEAGWYSPEQMAWADLREAPEGGSDPQWPRWTAAWCHGAFGIGAVRWRLHEMTGDLSVLADASLAVEAARRAVAEAGRARREGVAADVTLCHGVGGALDLLLLAYEVTGERDHLVAARRVADLCLAIRTANDGRWTVGLRGAEVVPGLFTGLAGIAVLLLRAHDPSAVASPMLPGRSSGPSQGLRQDVQPSASAST